MTALTSAHFLPERCKKFTATSGTRKNLQRGHQLPHKPCRGDGQSPAPQLPKKEISRLHIPFRQGPRDEARIISHVEPYRELKANHVFPSTIVAHEVKAFRFNRRLNPHPRLIAAQPIPAVSERQISPMEQHGDTAKRRAI